MIRTLNKIIVAGKIGSGKDTVSDYLVVKYGFTKLFFAEGIYEIAEKYFGMQTKDRVLLQSIGQKMREIRPSVWIDYTFNQVKNFNNIVISDCRQENEYLRAIKEGFYPVYIETNLDKCIERVTIRDGKKPDISRFNHESERGADKYIDQMYIIDNNGTLEDLYKQVDKLMEKYHD